MQHQVILAKEYVIKRLKRLSVSVFYLLKHSTKPCIIIIILHSTPFISRHLLSCLSVLFPLVHPLSVWIFQDQPLSHRCDLASSPLAALVIAIPISISFGWRVSRTYTITISYRYLGSSRTHGHPVFHSSCQLPSSSWVDSCVDQVLLWEVDSLHPLLWSRHILQPCSSKPQFHPYPILK